MPFRDKAFQVDMLHTDKSTPSPPKSQQMSNQVKSPFEAHKLKTALSLYNNNLYNKRLFVLPSNSCVGLMNQRDGQIQTVVREFVLRIGATTKEQ